MSSNMDVPSPDIDPNFEPQIRARSNTWPLRPKEFVKEEAPSVTPPIGEEKEEGEGGALPQCKDQLGVNKKTSSRRNAWGNMSYADLITKAIQGSPEQRLTLSQVYEWMVQNIPYFKDKGDSNSSAGWKNSIRHNLSLHSRFMRIQNEGTGKSSWWVINPDAKPGKTPRRRAASMDTKAYEKKRGRAKKKAEAMRANLEHGLSPSSNSLNEESSFSDNFNLSPQDFRERTCSNASSVGRLSPIQSALEPDMHDSQVPPMSPIPWIKQESMSTTSYNADGFTETLTESLREMIVGDTMNALSPMENLVSSNGGATGNGDMASSLSTPSPLNQQQLSPSSTGSLSYSESGSLMPAPPPYPDQMRTSPQHSRSPQPSLGIPTTSLPSMSALNQSIVNSSLSSSMNGSSMQGQGLVGCMGLSGGFMQQQQQQQIQHPEELMAAERSHMFGSQSPQRQQAETLLQESLARSNLSQSLSNYHSAGFPNEAALRHALLRQQLQQQQQQQQQAQMFHSPQLSPQAQRRLAILRQSLTIKTEPQEQMEMQPPQPQTQLLQQLLTAPDNPTSGGLSINTGSFQQPQSHPAHPHPQQQQPQQHSPFQPQQQNLPQDIDFSLCDFKAPDLDMDQIIKHELSFDSNLDFNFDAQQAESQFGAIRT